MGWIPAPHLAGERPSYLQMYRKILSDYRIAPLSSASAVVLLVAPNVDALCASRMLAAMFKYDDIGYRIIPVSGRLGLEIVREDLINNKELRNLILLGMGGTYDLPLAMWFGDFDLSVTVHVIDAARPLSLPGLFMGGQYGDRIVFWDDGTCEELIEEKRSYEAYEYGVADSDDDHDFDDGDETDVSDAGDVDDTSADLLSPTSRKRRRESGDTLRKRVRREEKEEAKKSLSREEMESHQRRLDKYYTSGTSYGQGVACTIYVLATELDRVDNELLWFAILGVTYQYVGSKISREKYDHYHTMFYDEVSRLHTQPAQNEGVLAPSSINPDDDSVTSTEELRFMLWRHWTLYDAMYHSSYVAGKLGLWKERGRSRLTGLLAKMGLSINQSQQPYLHMDMDLKKTLFQKLEEIAPEYGLIELSYPSFMKYYGFHTQPLSASDAVEGISALIDVAEGVRMEIEIEGAKNGGDWFGARRMWEAKSSDERDRNNRGTFNSSNTEAPPTGGGGETQALDQTPPQDSDWWVRNFWAAYDSLSSTTALRESLGLAMAVHRAIVRTGTSIIDKHDIKTMRNNRIVILNQGPDLALFVHSGMLTRLALWLIDALRDQISSYNTTKAKQRGLPILLACLNESKNCFSVVGLTASPAYDQVQLNKFSNAFSDAIAKCNLDAQYGSFDASVVEIEREDLHVFLDTVCRL